MQPQTQKVQPFVPPPPPPPGAVQRLFTTGTDTMDAEIRITSHAGEITGDDIAFLKDYLSFLEKGWSRRKSVAATPVAAPEPVPAMMSGPPPSMSPYHATHDYQADGNRPSRWLLSAQINAMTPQEAQNNIRKAQP